MSTADLKNSVQNLKLWIVLSLLSLPCLAQTNPNGYSVPTSGIGLSLRLGPGSCITAAGSVVNYGGGTVAVTTNKTTFGYIDPTCTITTNTTGFPSGSIPIFTAVAGLDFVKSITDSRVNYVVSGAASSGTVTHTAGSLTANLPVIGNGGADITVGTSTGNTTQFATWTGATTASRCVHTDASGNLNVAASDCQTGTVTSIATTSPITGGTITTTGTIACATCAIGPGSSTTGHLATFSGTDGVTLADGGAPSTGTVTHTAGSLTLNCNVVGNGSADLKCSAVTTDDGTTFTSSGTGGILASGAGGLKAGANGGSVGVVNLNGNTSGTATITAPAVAGTATNQVVFSNNIQVPTGDTTHASIGLGSTNNGLAVSGSSPIMLVGGSQIAQFTSTGLLLVAGDYKTNTNCAGVGTAANPSVVTCTGAPAGAFSCATNASGGTCQVNTAIVTANSEIFIQENASEGARLGVTCNTTADTPTGPRLASKSAGASFTINLGTVTTNPTCYDFFIIN